MRPEDGSHRRQAPLRASRGGGSHRPAMRSAPRESGMRPSNARSGSPLPESLRPGPVTSRPLPMFTPHAPATPDAAGLSTLRAVTPIALEGQSARQRSASAVCRLRRHLVAVAVPRVLRDERFENAAPQLLSIDAPFHSELSGYVTAPGFAGSPLRGAVPGFTPPGGGANSLFHSAPQNATRCRAALRFCGVRPTASPERSLRSLSTRRAAPAMLFPPARFSPLHPPFRASPLQARNPAGGQTLLGGNSTAAFTARLAAWGL